jgi:hypothetical protein
LVDGLGYSYTKKSLKKDSSVIWRSPIRPPAKEWLPRKATLSHHWSVSLWCKKIHRGQAITAEAKQKVLGSLYDSALKIFEPILIDLDVLLPDPKLVVWSMNRARQASCPPNPTNLLFDVQHEFIPEK